MPDAKDLLPQPDMLTLNTIAGLKVAKPTIETYINMLVYGEAGVGKTRLTGSSVLVPQMQPVLLVDFEGGTLSLAGDMREIDVVRLNSWEKMGSLYSSLYDKNPYKTVIIDSLSECQKFSMGEIMRAVVAKDGERDPDVASLREWGKNGEQIRRMVRAFRDLPCHALFTALVSEDKDERDNTWKIRPGLPGKLKGEVAGYVDIVMYMYKKEVRDPVTKDRSVKTLVLTQGTDRQVAKDRSGKLPVVIEAPTMQDIYERISQ